MRRVVLAALLPLLVGCADFDFAGRPTIFGAKRDRPDLPKYLEKHESLVLVNGTRPQLLAAQRDALLILGCSDIREGSNTFRGDRAFVPGFMCGVGGETLYVTTDELSENRHSVRVLSYKRYPYPAAPRFLDADFCDLLVQLLSDPHDAPSLLDN